MITKTHIKADLNRINRLYLGPCSSSEAQFFSKLATLELCGWIEVSMDDIVLQHSRRTLRELADREYCEKRIVKPIYGFDYSSHFRKMLMGLIGLEGVARLERQVDRALFDPMLAALTALKPSRDIHAHTHLKGATLQLDAPSTTLVRFNIVYAGLRDIETVLKSWGKRRRIKGST